MRGNNTVPIPGELVSVAVDGVVSSADGIFDYQQSKTQETLNQEMVTAASQAAQRLTTVETAQTTLADNINTTVNARLEAAQAEFDASISENNQSVQNKVTQMTTKMSEVENELTLTRADNQLTRDAIADLSVDQQGALALATKVEQNEDDIEVLQAQQNGYTLQVVTEQQYETMKALDNLDQNTLYFVKES